MGRLLLAPMEGLADDILRGVLTDLGGYDGAVTEFARVAGDVLPRRFFTRIAPELENGGLTRSGTPVAVQLLGSDPEKMAASAARLATLAPPAIDLNFGCPAPLVNRHGGGAALLDDPDLLHAIAAAVRRAVPAATPVTAKMRLGVSDTARALDCAAALVAAGVSELTVHARTRDDRFDKPARWEWIARVRESVAVPVVANGDVFTVADYFRCREVSGCADVMLGRGAVADPWLAQRIRVARGEATPAGLGEWAALARAIDEFWRAVRQKLEPRHAPGRLKMVLRYQRDAYPEAADLYAEIRPLRDAAAIDAVLVGRLAA